MTPEQKWMRLLFLVKKMREAQDKYLSTWNTIYLNEAKKHAREVDKFVDNELQLQNSTQTSMF